MELFGTNHTFLFFEKIVRHKLLFARGMAANAIRIHTRTIQRRALESRSRRMLICS